MVLHLPANHHDLLGALSGALEAEGSPVCLDGCLLALDVHTSVFLDNLKGSKRIESRCVFHVTGCDIETG